MTNTVKRQIQALVDLETEGWDTKNPDLFLSMIHPDMAWPWPPTSDAHDPKADKNMHIEEADIKQKNRGDS